MVYFIDQVKKKARGVKLKELAYNYEIYKTLQLKSDDITAIWAINKLRLLIEDGYCQVSGKQISILPEERIIIKPLLDGLISTLLEHIAYRTENPDPKKQQSKKGKQKVSHSPKVQT